MVDPEYQLDENARAQLVALTKLEGFQVLQKLFEAEVAKFQVRLINCDVTNPEDVLATHTLTKAAAQYYSGVISRLNQEIAIFENIRHTGPLPDVTEEMMNT